MSYVFVEDVAASWEQYQRFAAALAGPAPAGLILHAAGPTDEGFRIVGVWESEEAWLRFADLVDSARESAEPLQVFRALQPEHVVYGPGVRFERVVESIAVHTQAAEGGHNG
jgi:hypothetical protein